MSATTVAFDDAMARFVEAQVRDGRYSNADEVVRAALLLLERQEREDAELREAILEGEASDISNLSFDEIWESALGEEKERRG